MRRLSALLVTALTASGLVVAGPAVTAHAKTYTGPSELVLDARSQAQQKDGPPVKPQDTKEFLFEGVPVTDVPTLVKAKVVYEVNSDAPIDKTHGTLVSLSLKCPGASTGAAQNIIRGKKLTFTPHLLTRGKAGFCSMTVRAETGKDHPDWSRDEDMKVTIESSKLTVSKAAPGAAEGRPKTGSVLVDIGKDINVAEVSAEGPKRWVAQAKMTGCTGLNGSKDGSNPKAPQLCRDHYDGKAPSVKVRVVVQRRCATAKAGKPEDLYTEDVTITRATHHYTWFASGTTIPSCKTGTPRVKIYMKHLAGPAFVAHRGFPADGKFPGNDGVTAIAVW